MFSETDERRTCCRPVQLRRVPAQLCKGDVLMVTRLDRLARSEDQTTYCSITLLRAGDSQASLALTRMSEIGATRTFRNVRYPDAIGWQADLEEAVLNDLDL